MKDTEFIEVPGAAPPEAAAIGVKGFRVKDKSKAKRLNGSTGEDADLVKMNADYAVVRIGGKTRVMGFEESPARRGISIPVYSTIADFKAFHANRRKTVKQRKGDAEKTVKIGMGAWWIDHEKRRQYNGVVYEPGVETPGKFNLWTGFACQPRPGDCSLYLAHLRDNISSGNAEHFEYLLNWMAWGVQNPGERAEVAVVMRGGEGAGKGMGIKSFGSLFGAHFAHVSRAQHLVGNFNAHLQQCSVLFADEAFFAGDRTHDGTLKALITEDTIRIEPKGVDSFDVRNCLHILMSSNSDWVIPAGADARRYFVLTVSEARKQDHAYFAAIAKQMENGGREALLHYLMHRDVSGFNIRAVPMTEALADQKAYSRRDLDLLVETLATEGMLPVPRVGNAAITITSGERNSEGFYPAARKLVPSLKHMSSIVIKRRLCREWGCEDWHSGSTNGIVFPLLSELRRLFDAKHGRQKWPEVQEWQE
jgi:hypothetical protein